MAQEVQNIQKEITKKISETSGLAIVVGLLIMVMGILAMGAPLMAGLSVSMMVGLLLMICGMGQMLFSSKVDKRAFTIFIGLFNVVIGGFMLSNIIMALDTLTIVLAFYLIASGIYEAVVAFQIKPVSGWGWMLTGAIVSFFLGGMIWSQFPASGVWAIGLLIGVRLFFSGWTLLMLGIAGKGIKKSFTLSPPEKAT